MAFSEESLVTPALLLKMGAWRYPFFLVDRICEFKRGPRGYISAIKNVSFNEPQFTGHFPEQPIMPGVLMAEALGQTSHYLSLLTVFAEEYERRYECDVAARRDLQKAMHSPEGMAIFAELRAKWGGVLAAQELKYKHMVVPGDVLELRSEPLLKDAGGFMHFRVEARVGRKVAVSGKVTNYWFEVAKGASNGE